MCVVGGGSGWVSKVDSKTSASSRTSSPFLQPRSQGFSLLVDRPPREGKSPENEVVPFWIVERSREIAEREKPGANERRGTWGEVGKRGKEKKGTALLAVTDAFRVTPPTIR